MGVIADQQAYNVERRRLLTAAQQAVRDRLRAPSDIARTGGTSVEVAAARVAMREALEQAERDVDEQLAPLREDTARARREQLEREHAAAEAAQRDRDEHLERELREVPPDLVDGLAVDTEVADLEQRVAAGDESVTVEQLAAAREGAASRLRFGRLREVADRRRAEREAAEAERQRVERVEAAAVEQLERVSPALVAERYDAARAALDGLLEVLDDRVALVVRLARAGGDERLPGASPAYVEGPMASSVEVAGAVHAAGDADAANVVGPLLAGVGIGVRSVQVDRGRIGDVRTPTIVEQGRADTASVGDGGRAERRRVR